MFRFIIASLVLAVAMWSSVLLGAYQHWWHEIPSYLFVIVSFLFITTLLLYYFLAPLTRSASFTQAYLLSMVLKMGLYGAFVIIVIFVDPTSAVSNSIFFLAGYFLFTALEVGFLFRLVNR